MNPDPNTLVRSFNACLLGAAIGDSLGLDYDLEPSKPYYQMFPRGADFIRPQIGSFTEATQMALWTAEGLILTKHSDNHQEYLKGLVDSTHEALMLWLRTQGVEPKPKINLPSDLIHDTRIWFEGCPSITCLDALSEAPYVGCKSSECSAGSSPVTRVAPLALVVPRDSIWKAAEETSALTHQNVVARHAAAVWAVLLSDVFHGEPLFAAIEHALEMCEQNAAGVIYFSEISDCIWAALNATKNGSPKFANDSGGGHLAASAVSIALYAALAASGDLQRGLQIAVTHDGCSNTTGAIAGSLLGLLYPDQVFEHPRSTQLQARDLIDQISVKLAKRSSTTQSV